jgi:glyoxylase-like metal-dependent hydrolase (beta-lactamase superfamily II)
MLDRYRLLIALAALGAFMLLRHPSEAQPATVKEIAKGVWFREGELSTLGHCNNVIIEMKDYLIVVDANFPSGAKLAMEAAKKVSNKPVKYVFDTHHHGDHAYGNSVWTAAGATTLAYKGVTEEMARYEPKRWQDTSKQRKDVADLHQNSVEPPKQTFDKSPFILNDGTREVRFYFFGWAHTRGDGFVYLPKEKILATGDAVANGPFNYTADGNIGNWPKVIAEAQKLDVERVLPGHGAPAGKDLLAGQAQFMTELHNAAAAAVAQKKKPEDMKLPDSVKNWIGPSLPGQLKDAYKEVSEHKAAGDLPH